MLIPHTAWINIGGEAGAALWFSVSVIAKKTRFKYLIEIDGKQQEIGEELLNFNNPYKSEIKWQQTNKNNQKNKK